MDASSSSDCDSDSESILTKKLISSVERNNYARLADLFRTSERCMATRDRNYKNNTLLHTAIVTRRKHRIDKDVNKRIIEFLIKNGVDLEAQNDDGLTAYDLFRKISKKTNPDIEQLLQSNEERELDQSNVTYATSGLKDSLHGVIFQLQLLVLFLHRSLKIYESIWLATELNDAEKFDDVALKFKGSGDQAYTWRFLQAKHLMYPNRNLIRKNELFRRKGKGYFFLLKYFESFVKITTNEYFRGDNFEEFTICTNTRFHENAEAYFSEVEEFKNDDKLFFSNQSMKKYRLAPNAKSELEDMLQKFMIASSDQDVRNFMDKFRFVICYPDKHVLNALIAEELGESFGLLDAKFVASDFKNTVLEWLASYKEDMSKKTKESEFLQLMDGRRFLSDVESRIATWKAGEISRGCVEKLQNYEVEFTLHSKDKLDEFLGQETLAQILWLSTETPLLSYLKTTQYLLQNKTKLDSCLFLTAEKLEAPDIKNVVLEAFSSSYTLLLVTFNLVVQDMFERLLSILGKNQSKRLVIIGQDNDFLEEEVIESDINFSKLQENLTGFKDLTPSAQQQLLKKTIHLQNNSMTWSDILNSDLVEKLIDHIILEAVVSKDEIRVDHFSVCPKLNEPCYVKRTFSSCELTTITEDDLMQPNFVDKKVVLLAGDPGIGKSTFISNLTNSLLIKSNDKSWVKLVNLNDSLKWLEETTFTEDTEAISYFADMLFEKNCYIEKKLFILALQSKLNVSLKVILIFDGFSDISPECQKKALILLKVLQKSHVYQMWVATRTQDKSELEEVLETSTLLMNFLDSTQENEVIEKYRNQDPKYHKKDCQVFKNIIKKFKQFAAKKFAATPLHIKMLMELLICLPEEEFENIELAQIYEQFIHMKSTVDKDNSDPYRLDKLQNIARRINSEYVKVENVFKETTENAAKMVHVNEIVKGTIEAGLFVQKTQKDGIVEKAIRDAIDVGLREVKNAAKNVKVDKAVEVGIREVRNAAQNLKVSKSKLGKVFRR